MGFFSWNCKSCNKSIRSGHASDGHQHWMSKAVASNALEDLIAKLVARDNLKAE